MWTKAPALLLAIAIICGILCGYFLLDSVTSICISISLFTIVVAVVIVLAKKSNGQRLYWVPLAFAGGVILGQTSQTRPIPESIADTKGTIEGRIEKVTQSVDKTHVIIDAQKWTSPKSGVTQEVDFKIKVTLPYFLPETKKGATLTATGKLLVPDSVTDVPYQTDYNRFHFIDGTAGRMIIYSSKDFSINTATIKAYEHFLDKIRTDWLTAISNAGFDAPTTNFLLAVIGGDDLLLDYETEQQFRQTGIAHILAISGLHISIILVVLTFLLYPLKVYSHTRVAYFLLTGGIIMLYAFVTGGSPSACRAAVMGCIILGNRLFEIRNNLLQALSVAIIILLCINPRWIFQPGFQFSVCAVLGIISAMPILKAVPHKYRKVWAIIVIPVVAVTATLIPTILYFNTITLNFWLPNIIASAFVPPIISIGFIASLLSAFGLHTALLLLPGDWLYMTMQKLINSLSGIMPDSTISVFPNTLTLALIGISSVLIVWLIWNYTHRRALVIGFVLITAIFFVPESDSAAPTAELYVPRHSDNTDIIILTRGHNYLVTTARDSIGITDAAKNASKKYSRLFNKRKLPALPTPIDRDTMLSRDGLNINANILTIHGRTLVRIDNDTTVPLSIHADIALVSNLYTGEMTTLVNLIHADTIVLSSAIHPSRRAKFERQLDTLNVTWRNMRKQPISWQFK